MMVQPDQWEAAASIAGDPALSEGFCPRCHGELIEPILGVDPISDGTTLALATACTGCGAAFILKVWEEAS